MNTLENKQDRFFLVLGLTIMLLGYVFFLVRGERIVVEMHDQLDSDVSYLVLKSRDVTCLFQSRFLQFMQGEAEVSVASFGSLLFYLLLPPVYAFITNMFFVRIVAFLSLYYLLRYYETEKIISFLTAMVFSFLPIYSVYGLSCMGIALVWLSIIKIEKNRKMGYVGIAIYGLFSSVILAGFAVLGAMVVFILIKFVQKKRQCLATFAGLMELLFVYIFTNIDLIKSIFVKNDFVSHKLEYQFSAKPFVSTFADLLLNGQYHAVSLHKYIIITVIVSFVIYLICLMRQPVGIIEKRKMHLLVMIMLLILVIALFYAGYYSEAGVQVRTNLFSGSPLIAFQFQRVHWLYPVLWYVAFGISLSLIYGLIKTRMKRVCIIACAIMWVVPSLYVFRYSDLVRNVRVALLGVDAVATWEKQYDETLFSEIENYIGRDKSDYRIVSVGLEPNVALYNGFYCLDGYSNNYNLSYKHKFGKMIDGELKNSSSLYDYYWKWGNRCYLFSSELNGTTFVPKGESDGINLYVDANALKEMGTNYIFSAVRINNAEELGLDFENYFENEGSYYEIFLYSLKE